MHPTPSPTPHASFERDQLEQDRDHDLERLERAAEPYLNLPKALPAPRADAPNPAAPPDSPAATPALLLATMTLDSRLTVERFRRALSGSYFNSDRAGDSHREGHLGYFEEAKQKLRIAADTPERERVALRLLEGFRDAYVGRIEGWLSSESRFYSAHISGPSKYPSSRMAKRRDVAHRKEGELYAWRVERVRRMLRIIALVGRTRLTRLEEIKDSLEACETKQAMMKAANALLRKHDYLDTPELRAALEPHGLRGLIVTKLLEPDWCKRRGFADYELTNNGAQVRRWRAALEAEQRRLARADEQPSSERTVKGVRLEEHIEDKRLRLHFPGKPDAATITNLKKSGWKWSPSNAAWQRILTNDARWNAEHVILSAYTEPQ